MMSAKKQAKNVLSGYARFWQAYGGVSALACSPYFLTSLVMTAATSLYWSQNQWWDLVLQIIPNLLSYSLGGFAMLLAFGSDKFRDKISGKQPGSDKESPYFSLATTFVHFLLLQTVTLLYAILAKAAFSVPVPELFLEWPNSVLVFNTMFWGLGFLLFIYSIFSAAAAVMAVYVIVRAFDDSVSHRRKNGSKQSD